jgi:hypothetical protein
MPKSQPTTPLPRHQDLKSVYGTAVNRAAVFTVNLSPTSYFGESAWRLLLTHDPPNRRHRKI